MNEAAAVRWHTSLGNHLDSDAPGVMKVLG